jgi:hypothetical protein
MISVLSTNSIFWPSQFFGALALMSSILLGTVRNSPAATVPPRAIPAEMTAGSLVFPSRKRATMAKIAAVVGRSLQPAIDGPARVCGGLRVFNPEVGHVGVVAKPVAQAAGHAEGRCVVERSDKDGWTAAQICKGRGVIAHE